MFKYVVELVGPEGSFKGSWTVNTYRDAAPGAMIFNFTGGGTFSYLNSPPFPVVDHAKSPIAAFLYASPGTFNIASIIMPLEEASPELIHYEHILLRFSENGEVQGQVIASINGRPVSSYQVRGQREG